MFFRDLDIIIPYKCVYLARLLIVVFYICFVGPRRNGWTDREQIVLGLVKSENFLHFWKSPNENHRPMKIIQENHPMKIIQWKSSNENHPMKIIQWKRKNPRNLTLLCFVYKINTKKLLFQWRRTKKDI